MVVPCTIRCRMHQITPSTVRKASVCLHSRSTLRDILPPSYSRPQGQSCPLQWLGWVVSGSGHGIVTGRMGRPLGSGNRSDDPKARSSELS
jgi:hypothetical protein